jgi:ABC-type uncharacterized transport system substrate-binding protein
MNLKDNDKYLENITLVSDMTSMLSLSEKSFNLMAACFNFAKTIGKTAELTACNNSLAKTA